MEKEVNKECGENLPPPAKKLRFLPTPPKRTGPDNPQRPFIKKRNVYSTNGTPSKGRPILPKAQSNASIEHQKRLEECPGCLYEASKPEGKKDVRKDCIVCGAKTRFMCSICRLPFCFYNRDERIKSAIERGDKRVSFLGGVRPASKISFTTSEGKTMTVENSCFHMRHQKMLDKVSKQFGAGYKQPSAA